MGWIPAVIAVVWLVAPCYAQVPFAGEGKSAGELSGVLPKAKPCPAGTAFAGEGEARYEGMIGGHFLASTSEDAVVSATGCEPHADLFGGTYLLSRQGGAWHVVWYRAGILTRHCRKTNLPDGRHGLVCYLNDVAQGVTTEALYTLELRREKDAAEPRFFFATSDSTGNCLADDRARRSEVKHVVFDGRAVTVTATLGERRLSRDECEDLVDGSASDTAFRVKTYRVRYVFDGKRFRAAPGSKATARLFAPVP